MKWKKYLAATSVAVVLFCVSGCEKEKRIPIYEDGTAVLTDIKKNQMSETAFETEQEEIPEHRTEDTSVDGNVQTGQKKEIYVYICGAVEHPGVVKVTDGARVYEAIEAAGGLTEEAADCAVNQAAVLEDGQQITVPSLEEAADWKPEVPAPDDKQEGQDSAGDTEKVNINQAAADELMSLPGIGEAKAAGIIEYRETTGGFRTIEEIKNISGIGEAVFEKIKDKIEI